MRKETVNLEALESNEIPSENLSSNAVSLLQIGEHLTVSCTLNLYASKSV